MAGPSQRNALGALFLVIAAAFAGIAYAAGKAGGSAWVIAASSAVLAVWMLGLAIRGLRSRH
jgi:membrane protein YdbS with pleckstrin-like domain